MITIAYPYRNRDITRIKNSLESLRCQTNSSFIVIFVDYGSKQEIAEQVKKLVTNYNFATYHYAYTIDQPWNKSKALNFALSKTKTPYFFVADVDVIFHPQFIHTSLNLTTSFSNIYFKVGFLSKQESLKQKKFKDYTVKFESSHEATGLTLFKVEDLKTINGFDEYYHFWGAEDTDVHVRLKNTKKQIHFYQKQLLLLHQWHINYVNSQKNILTANLQIRGIVQRNHEYLNQVRCTNKVKANHYEIGKLISKDLYDEINQLESPVIILNRRAVFENWFYTILCKKPIEDNIYVCFKQEAFFNSKLFFLKRILGKKTPDYISLKEINDIVLSYVTSNLHTYNYVYKISDDLKSITLKILA